MEVNKKRTPRNRKLSPKASQISKRSLKSFSSNISSDSRLTDVHNRELNGFLSGSISQNTLKTLSTRSDPRISDIHSQELDAFLSDDDPADESPSFTSESSSAADDIPSIDNNLTQTETQEPVREKSESMANLSQVDNANRVQISEKEISQAEDAIQVQNPAKEESKSSSENPKVVDLHASEKTESLTNMSEEGQESVTSGDKSNCIASEATKGEQTQFTQKADSSKSQHSVQSVGEIVENCPTKSTVGVLESSNCGIDGKLKVKNNICDATNTKLNGNECSSQAIVAEPIEDKCSPIKAYLLPKEFILQHRRIPSFHNAFTHLLPVRSWEKAPRFIFISHTWMSALQVDDNLRTKSSVIILFLKNLRHASYVWIDYACVKNMNNLSTADMSHLYETISNACRILVVPFKSSRIDSPPTYNLKNYSRRAWCAFEYAIFMKRPSIVRIANIVKENNSFHLRLVSLPTFEHEVEIDCLVDGLQLLREAVKEEVKGKFVENFSCSVEMDLDLIWTAMLELSKEIFSTQRRKADFYVMTSAAAGLKSTAQAPEVYDDEAVAKMNAENKGGRECEICENPCSIS